MFNRREQLAILLLTGALLVGTVVSAVDYYRPELMEDFQVIPGAVAVPPAPGTLEAAGSGAAAPAEATQGGGLVDVNRASAKELESLPHIGPAMAARIVEHRRRHGPFQDVADLRRVSGIGDRTLERLRPHVLVGGAP